MRESDSATLMTEGSIWKKITFFAVPIFLGNLFQQMYNTADSLIVGNFLGSNALAAVSSSGNLIYLMIGFFNGIALGAGVVIARYFGARDQENVEKAVHTTVAFGIVASIVLTIVGVFFAPQILVWMQTPAKWGIGACLILILLSCHVLDLERKRGGIYKICIGVTVGTAFFTTQFLTGNILLTADVVKPDPAQGWESLPLQTITQIPVLWRAAEAVSLAALIFLIVMGIVRRRKSVKRV